MKKITIFSTILIFILSNCTTLKKYKELEEKYQNLLSEYNEATNQIESLEKLNLELQDQISNQQAVLTEEKTKLEETHSNLVMQLKSEIEKGEIEIQKIKDVLTMNIADQIFFNSGEAELSSNGIEVLKKVAQILNNIPEKMILIEGHTDNQPIGKYLTNKFPSNWELAGARAINVARFLHEVCNVDPKRLSAISYSEYRPIASNKTAKGRAKNRRIEIVLVNKQLYQIADYKKSIKSKQ